VADFFKHIEFNKGVPAKGKLLISEPFMFDFNFKRTVILIAQHSSSEGTTGFVLNRKSEYLISDVYPEFCEPSLPVFIGGPVGKEFLFFIHRLGDQIEDTQHIVNDLYWGGNLEQINELLKNKSITPNDIRFFIGYSGWSEGQLEYELEEHSWIVAKMKGKIDLTVHDEIFWKKAMAGIGKHFKVMANFPEDPSKN